MRRVSLFLTMLVLAAILLAACGGEQPTATSVPSTSVPPATVAATSTTEMTATEAPTEAPGTGTTSTPGIPVTGAGAPSQAITKLIGTSVCGLGGEQIGSVKDAVLDFNLKAVTYIIVDAKGKAVPVPYSFLAKPKAGETGTASGTGTGTGTSAQVTDTPSAGGTGTLATDTPSAGGAVSTATSSAGGTGTLATDTPSAGGAVSTATSTTGTGSGTGTGTGATGQQNCMTLTVSTDVFNKVPAFDESAMPAMGESSADWDTNIMPYWVGGVEDIATNTPEPTSTPSSAGATGTSTPSAGGTTSSTATATTSASSSGTGNSSTPGAQQMSGVVLASKLLGASISVSPQGAGTSAGTGSQGTVQDVIIEPRIGKLQYLVVSLSSSADTWIPVPISLMGWDATNNQIVLMVDANLLQNAPGFSSSQLPDTTMSGWDQQFSSYWQSGGSGSGTGTGGTASSTATATP